MSKELTACQRAMRYAEAVRKGKLDVPKPVQQCVEKWYAYREAYGLNEEEVNIRVRLAEMLYAPEGEIQLLRLMDWQCFIATWLYGFRTPEGLRCINDWMTLVPRKAGKTTMASAFTLGEVVMPFARPGAKVKKPNILIAGETDEVCDLAYEKLISMLKQDIEHGGDFKDAFGITFSKNEIRCDETDGRIWRQTAGAKNLEGHTASMIYVDEISRMPTRHALNAFRSGFGRNPNYLMFITTTFSDEKMSALEPEREDVLSWLKDRDNLGTSGGILYEATLDDDYLDKKVWIRTQPAWYEMPGIERYYINLAKRAVQDEEALYSFQARQLCVPLRGGNVWIRDDELRKLDNLTGPASTSKGWVHFIGCDFSDTMSTSSLTLLSIHPQAQKREARFHIFFCSGRGFKETDKDDETKRQIIVQNQVHKIYNQWAKDGHVEVADGEVISHRRIAEKIEEWDTKYNARMIIADHYDAYEEVRSFLPPSTKMKMRRVGKGQMHITAPAHLLKNWVRTKALKLEHNPVVFQHFINTHAILTPQGGMKLEKVTPNSPHKIDAVDSLVQAILAHDICRDLKTYGQPINPIDNTTSVRPGQDEEKDESGSWVLGEG